MGSKETGNRFTLRLNRSVDMVVCSFDSSTVHVFILYLLPELSWRLAKHLLEHTVEMSERLKPNLIGDFADA